MPVNQESSPIGRGTPIGRMVVIGPLGAGGMGVVHVAYDPELDRKVAIKMIRPDRDHDGNAQTRLLREAQALAKLAHPNVVAIHDVGTHGPYVWIAMEYVAGKTVGQWLAEPRSWREVVRVFAQAGRGVEAAHRAGLLHRDLKPSNIIVGDDGRVRVMDFGIARAEQATDRVIATHGSTNRASLLDDDLTPTNALLGTPAYMAPEHFVGLRCDARGDQFSFCVALWEALYGQRPFAGDTLPTLAASIMAGRRAPIATDCGVPGWLRRVVERGLSARPEHRFATMTGLLAALDRDPTKRRRAASALVGVALVGAGWFGLQQVRHQRATAACALAATAVDADWNAETRAALRDGLASTGVSFASTTAERAEGWFDAYAHAWKAAREEVCLAAEVEHTWTPEVAAAAEDCLDERRQRLGALLRTLSDSHEAEDAVGLVRGAVAAAAQLPEIETCRSETRLLAHPSSPEDAQTQAEIHRLRGLLIDAVALGAAGRFADGLVRVEEARGDAEALGWAPLQAMAALEHGRLLAAHGDYALAESALESAFFTAGSAGDDETFMRAAAALTFVVGYRQERFAEGIRWGTLTLTLLARAGIPDSHLAWGTSLNNLGTVLHAKGADHEAIATLQRALTVREAALGPDHPDTAVVLVNLGAAYMGLDDLARARETLERALELLERSLGPDHPDLATVLSNLGVIRGNADANEAAVAMLERALALSGYGTVAETRQIEGELNNLGVRLLMAGDYARAVRLFERAVTVAESLYGPEHAKVACARINLGNALHEQGDYARALEQAGQGLTLAERTLGPDHKQVATALSVLSATHHATGRLAEARAASERALTIYTKALGPDHRNVGLMIQNIGALYNEMGEHAQAIEHYQRALTILERASEPDQAAIAIPLNNLGNAYRDLGRYAEAVPYFDRSISARRAAHGVGHPGVAIPLVGLATLHLDRREYDRASELFAEAESIVTAALSSDHIDLVPALTGLGRVHLERRELVAARELLERALGLCERRGDPIECSDTRFALARTLWPTDPARSLELAVAAHDRYKTTGAAPEQARVRAWLDRHRIRRLRSHG